MTCKLQMQGIKPSKPKQISICIGFIKSLLCVTSGVQETDSIPEQMC